MDIPANRHSGRRIQISATKGGKAFIWDISAGDAFDYEIIAETLSQKISGTYLILSDLRRARDSVAAISGSFDDGYREGIHKAIMIVEQVGVKEESI